jgi:nitroreductase
VVDIDRSRFYEADPRPDVPAGAPWEAWRIAVLPVAELAALAREGGGVSSMQLAYLAAFGLLAPTSHNTVPQRFALRPASAEIHVRLDRRAVLSESDPTGRQAVISVGCAIANVELAARSVGWGAHVRVLDVPPQLVQPFTGEGEPEVTLAVIQLAPSDAPPPHLEWRELMRQRKMVRAEYDRAVSLPPALADELRAQVRELGGLQLHLIDDGPTKLFLGKFQELADSTVINREGFARELGDWLLDNDDESPLGMRGREFGLSDAAAQRFHRGLRGELRLLPDETAAFAKVGNIGMRSASAIGVITVADDDLTHRLGAGRAYQHAALTLLRHGFVVAMHAGITEVTAPNMALRGRLKTRHRPEVVFRMGRPLHPEDGERPHASRPSLESILRDAGDP